MKTVLLTLTAILLSASSFGQGTLIFNNRTQTGDAPASLPDGRGAGAIPGMVAQLYLVQPGGALTALTPTTTFRTSSEAAMFFINSIDEFAVDGVLPGQPATVRMRVYQGNSYEEARASFSAFHGESNDVTIGQLGGTPAGGAPIPTPSLNGLMFFVLVPEPSSIAIGLLGAGALLLGKRKLR